MLLMMWLYHDLLGGENRLGAVQFISLFQTKDQIIILRIPFHKKWRELINSPYLILLKK